MVRSLKKENPRIDRAGEAMIILKKLLAVLRGLNSSIPYVLVVLMFLTAVLPWLLAWANWNQETEQIRWDLFLEYTESQEKSFITVIFLDYLPDGGKFMVSLTRVIEEPVSKDWHFSALLAEQTGKKPLNLSKETTLDEIISLVKNLRQREEDEDFIIFYKHDW